MTTGNTIGNVRKRIRESLGSNPSKPSAPKNFKPCEDTTGANKRQGAGSIIFGQVQTETPLRQHLSKTGLMQSGSTTSHISALSYKNSPIFNKTRDH